MSGVVAGLIGSLKAAVISLINKYFVLNNVYGSGNQFYGGTDYTRDVVIDSSENIYFFSSPSFNSIPSIPPIRAQKDLRRFAALLPAFSFDGGVVTGACR